MSDDVARLRALGLSEHAAEQKAVLLTDARAALAAMRDSRAVSDACAFWVPGRIEFLGKHTDYAGGRSLLCAIDRGICIVATPRTDRRIRITDARVHETVEIEIDASANGRAGHWSTYPLTVARRIARDFGELAASTTARCLTVPNL